MLFRSGIGWHPFLHHLALMIGGFPQHSLQAFPQRRRWSAPWRSDRNLHGDLGNGIDRIVYAAFCDQLSCFYLIIYPLHGGDCGSKERAGRWCVGRLRRGAAVRGCVGSCLFGISGPLPVVLRRKAHGNFGLPHSCRNCSRHPCGSAAFEKESGLWRLRWRL